MKTVMRRIWRAGLHTAMSVRPVRRTVRGWAGAGHVPRRLWNRLPVLDDPFEVTLPNGRRFRYRTTAGDAIGQAFYWCGLSGWEAASIHTFLALAERAHHFLDIGANTGPYTLLACTVNPQLKAVSYEPVPRVYDHLQANLRANGFGARCQAHQMAVSDEVGSTRFHVPHTAMPSSASLALDGFRDIRGSLIEVPMTTVDADIARQGDDSLPVDLIKIDVEGFEDRVLAGMSQVLSEHRPVIVCECNPDGPVAEVERILSRADYHFYHVCAPSLERMPSIQPDPSERYRNFACVPAENRETAELLRSLRLPG